MNILPEEIILHILNNLNYTIDVINFSLTCKYYRNIIIKNKEEFRCTTTFNKIFK